MGGIDFPCSRWASWQNRETWRSGGAASSSILPPPADGLLFGVAAPTLGPRLSRTSPRARPLHARARAWNQFSGLRAAGIVMNRSPARQLSDSNPGTARLLRGMAAGCQPRKARSWQAMTRSLGSELARYQHLRVPLGSLLAQSMLATGMCRTTSSWASLKREGWRIREALVGASCRIQ